MTPDSGSEPSELFSGATERAAVELADLAAKGLEISEKRLVTAVAEGIRQAGHPVVANRQLPVPNWDPRPGGTDLIVGGLDTPYAIAELKVSRLGRQPTLHETLWDAIKLASQVGASARRNPTLKSVRGAFLVVAAPTDHWLARPRDTWHVTARELLPAVGDIFAQDSRALFERHRCGWQDALWGGRGRPQRIAQSLGLTGVALAPFVHEGADWQLRCAEVSRSDEESLAFDGEWPARR